MGPQTLDDIEDAVEKRGSDAIEAEYIPEEALTNPDWFGNVLDINDAPMEYYYPESVPSKRYFFPFSDEPETHWGAFVPEKRDYSESIKRLQRLAMELSDNQS